MARNDKKSWMISFGSSVFIATALFPLDIQKTLKTISKANKVDQSATVTSQPVSVYYKQLLTPSGPQGRYKALLMNDFAVGVSWGIFRFVYDRALALESLKLNRRKEVLNGFRSKHQTSKHQTAVASLIASSASILGTHPLYNAKYAFIVNVWGHEPYGFTTLKDYFLSVYKEGGIRRLYRGIDSAFLSVPSVVIQMILYEKMKRKFPANISSRESSTGAQRRVRISTTVSDFLIPVSWAFTSKVAATSLTYPFNIVRMRQLYPAEIKTQMSTWHVLKKIVREEGIMSLYRGFGTHLQRTAAHNSLSLALFELWK